MNDSDLLDMATRIVLTDRAAMSDVMACERSGLNLLGMCRALYGWTDPADTIARGGMNAVQFVQALQCARQHVRAEA